MHSLSPSSPNTNTKVGTSEEWEILKLNSRSTSYTLEKIRCGSVYLFKIAAENVIGLGDFSTILTTKTNGNPPDGNPPLNEILDGNGTMIQIDLSRWPDGGCQLNNNFQIEYKPKDATNWQRIYRRDNTTRRFTFNSMSKVQYEIRITVENDAGTVIKLFEVESDSGKCRMQIQLIFKFNYTVNGINSTLLEIFIYDTSYLVFL